MFPYFLWSPFLSYPNLLYFSIILVISFCREEIPWIRTWEDPDGGRRAMLETLKKFCSNCPVKMSNDSLQLRIFNERKARRKGFSVLSISFLSLHCKSYPLNSKFTVNSSLLVNFSGPTHCSSDTKSHSVATKLDLFRTMCDYERKSSPGL